MASSYRHTPGFRRDDPDETEGRLLYRQLADAQTRRDIAMTRKARLSPLRASPESLGVSQEDPKPFPPPKLGADDDGGSSRADRAACIASDGTDPDNQHSTGKNT